MRLNRIKLAGFKSFVDPTTVNFPGNLVGVVGPNGCGKSNIIDAVRWVMGEISAKHLRGDSMADVVFNGSSSRKPVGTASVELVFDNADGQLGGQYANYAEVSLKRVVSRDGTSAYFLNGARCRRKDITQLFLGTGLGSRSYAIIEQGMISRIIEARPEELRGFIEEAAGISKYKERRRETENRISHTKENLERLNDLREEVEKQLRHLQRQAAAARRYQALKDQERRLTAELLALRLRQLDVDSQSKEGMLRERDTRMQAVIAEQRAVESRIETARQEFTAASEALQEVQGRYYQIGADISRSEQSIQHGREMRQRQRQDLEQVEQGLEEARLHLDRDQSQVDTLTAELLELEPELEAVRGRETAAAASLAAAEEAMNAWQERWESFNRDARTASETTQVERARIEQLENQLRRLVTQRERLGAELGNLTTADVERRIDELADDEERSRMLGESASERLAALAADLAGWREEEKEAAGRADQSLRRLQELQGRLTSLEALQQAALGLGQGKLVEWLAHHALDRRPRLAQQLTVDTGWERAVETVLGDYLEAVCVDGIDHVSSLLETLEGGTVTFFSAAAASQTTVVSDTRLVDHVRGPRGLQELLGGIFAVDTLGDALALRTRLAAGESVITRDGIWIGRDWLRVSRDQDVHAGVIEREQEMRMLRGEVAEAERRRAVLDGQLLEARAKIEDLERQREDAQGEINQLHRSHSETRAQLETLRSRAEDTAERVRRIAAEVDELEPVIADTKSAIEDARRRLAGALEAMTHLESERCELEAQRERLRDALGLARAGAAEARATAQDSLIKVESRRSARESILAGLARARTQLEQFETRRSELTEQLASGAEPLAELERFLEESLARRVAVEQELAEARRAVEATEAKIRELDHGRLEVEGRVEEARRYLDDIRLAAQELRVRREGLLEQFAATHLELDSVLEGLAAEASIEPWELRLAEVTQRIERLGPVNLAAIDEFRDQSERKEYLDRQLKDLTDALETLEAAIRKIDRETRTRFQETFDRVNAGLKDRFPRLFGGGHAYLELAGEDVLNAGVSIMARPPGKRNSTISQLSGGEKALTAVALVFSIFELNPAPFCLLDEVDAPLDDNNVGRFCDTVREMAERVQFVFITHNKSTMELASQLVGVTMNEPGVSRLVAVDIDEAVRMAAM